jgi:hypothetical protein
MQSITLRAQLGMVAAGYAAVSAFAAALLFARHLQELRYPAEASGGMWAAGDAMLYIFLACLFMIPTAFLIWVTAKFEAFYTAYSKFLLGISLCAPICLIVLYFGKNRVGETLINLCFCMLISSPFILLGMGVSRLVARFDRAKRFASYALLIEGLTVTIAVALLIHALVAPKNP